VPRQIPRVPAILFSEAWKSFIITECSTGMVDAATFTRFSPSGIPSTHSSVRIEARAKV
jgi:hypothetical protein